MLSLPSKRLTIGGALNLRWCSGWQLLGTPCQPMSNDCILTRPTLLSDLSTKQYVSAFHIAIVKR